MERVAIFGAGIAGLMTKIALDRAGIASTIYEQQGAHRADGMGFILLGAGWELLRQLGIDDRPETLGVPLGEYRQLTPQGQQIKTTPLPEGAVGLSRQRLLQRLQQQVAPADIRFDRGLATLIGDDAGQIQRAILSNGQPVIADLYVAADGINSRGRQALFPDWPRPEARVPEILGVVGAEFWPWADRAFHKFIDPAGGLAFGIVPVAADRVVWFMQFDRLRYPLVDRHPEAQASFVQSLVGHWASPIPEIIAATDFHQAHLWRPIASELIAHFYRGNLVLVGDAAHPLLPFTSQGLATAMTDAVVLADSLVRYQPLDLALASYSSQQRAHVLPFVASGHEMTAAFIQGSLQGAAPIAN